MRAHVKTIGAGLAGLVGLAAIAGLSAVPWSAPASSRATLRLSWRAVGERIEECRTPDAAEQERLPAHMRQAEICEGRVAPFVLRLELDGTLQLTDTLHGAGAQGDRPIHVYRELAVAPGEHDLMISFVSTAPNTAAAAANRPAGFPRTLRLRTSIVSKAGEAVLVTFDETARSLVTRAPRG